MFGRIEFENFLNIGLYITVEEGGTASGNSHKGEFSRFLGIPNAGNRLSSSMLFLLYCLIVCFAFCHPIQYLSVSVLLFLSTIREIIGVISKLFSSVPIQYNK